MILNTNIDINDVGITQHGSSHSRLSLEWINDTNPSILCWNIFIFTFYLIWCWILIKSGFVDYDLSKFLFDGERHYLKDLAKRWKTFRALRMYRMTHSAKIETWTSSNSIALSTQAYMTHKKSLMASNLTKIIKSPKSAQSKMNSS